MCKEQEQRQFNHNIVIESNTSKRNGYSLSYVIVVFNWLDIVIQSVNQFIVIC